MGIMRRALNGMRAEEAVESILNMFSNTKNNNELIEMVKRKNIMETSWQSCGTIRKLFRKIFAFDATKINATIIKKR